MWHINIVANIEVAIILCLFLERRDPYYDTNNQNLDCYLPVPRIEVRKAG